MYTQGVPAADTMTNPMHGSARRDLLDLLRSLLLEHPEPEDQHLAVGTTVFMLLTPCDGCEHARSGYEQLECWCSWHTKLRAWKSCSHACNALKRCAKPDTKTTMFSFNTPSTVGFIPDLR